jgi:hypothetical protein
LLPQAPPNALMTMREVAPVFFCLQHHQFAWLSFLCSLINLQFIAPQGKKKKKKKPNNNNNNNNNNKYFKKKGTTILLALQTR